MSITRFRIFLLVLSWCVVSATHAAPDIENLKSSLVTVFVKSGGIQHQSVGIVLGNEQVLAIRAEQKNNLQFSVKPWSGNAVLLATADEMNEKIDPHLPFMILHVPGLQLSAAGFLSSEPLAGLPAYSPITHEGVTGSTQGDSYEIKRGALADMLKFQPLTGIFFKKPKGPTLHLVSHNVLVTAEKFGSPVVNECGQVIAVSIADPRLNKVQRARNPKDTMVALVASQIIQWLQAAGIEINIAEEVCISAEQQTEAKAQEAEIKAQEAETKAQEAEIKAQEAEIKAQEAETKAQEAETKAQEAETKAQEAETKAETKVLEAEAGVARAKEAVREALSKATTSEAQKATVQQELEKAQNALDDALDDVSRNRQTAQVEIERIQEDATRQRLALFDKIKLYGGIAVGGLLFMLLLWLMSNRKKKTQIKAERNKVVEAERKAQKAIADTEARLAPFDCILEGQDSNGKRYLLKLDKATLGNTDGVVLGRNPRNSTFIISHEAISREHARLYIDDDLLYVHDLGSANGTCVNGKRLHANDSVQLVDGAMLDIGPIRFSVKVIS